MAVCWAMGYQSGPLVYRPLQQASHVSLHRALHECGPDLVLVWCQAVTCVQGDVRKPEHSAACVQQALERFQRLDILVNCAAGNFLVSLLPAWHGCPSNTERIGHPGSWAGCLLGESAPCLAARAT